MDKQRILIVDDNKNNIFSLKAVLEPLGLECDSATSGNEALFKVLEQEYLLFLLDVQMPEMDGFELAGHLKNNEDTMNVPIVFVTAINKEIQHVLSGFECGAVDYIFKPFNPDILISKIRVFLELESRKRELEQAYVNVYQTFIQQQRILSAAGEGIIGLDENGAIIYANSKAEQTLLAGKDSNLFGKSIQPFLSSEDWKKSQISRLCHHEGSVSDVEAFLIRGQEQVPVSYSCNSLAIDETSKGCVFVFRDLSYLKDVEGQLVRLSNYDDLTGLANRVMFHEYLTTSVAESTVHRRGQSFLALLHIDIDNFKLINDNLGNGVGDSILKIIASRINACTDENNLLSRLGGDEFVLILPEVKSLDDISRLTRNIQDAVAQKIGISEVEQPLYLACSIGVATTLEGMTLADELVTSAALALTKAKDNGKNQVHYYSDDLQEDTKQRFIIESKIKLFVETNAFDLHFQPKVTSENGQVIGAEALIRWPKDDASFVGPHVFIPIAEKSGQIQKLGDWVLKTSISHVASWLSAGVISDGFKLSINVSSLQLLDEGFSQILKNYLHEFRVDSHYVELEITESALMYEPQKVMKNLEEIYQHGVSVSIDDFGTGYSSLSYLTHLPLSILKIDKSFIDKIGCGVGGESVIKSIISLSNNLNLKTVAEGVEDEKQLQFLKEHGCDYIQGYYFSKPLPLADFENYLGNV
ncbi:EAL domain-containing protein [Thalassomonas actiniarum]|uniref:EAL domain-containing protein n=1 Tax=Thalassomonas actiniarum TaxID=485447 RepID=A0AAE9YJW6_9GAMM|nr:EAL domain-containing protein [Thalassomonas actiniarum]WDD97100.1 EAL domain-containing protein [Thalassomonas actiniarum]